MKLMFASDVHGSAFYCKKMTELYRAEKAERLIILGDILYHGPRNDLPRDYAPKEVSAVLNAMKDEILAVRGNCDAEVDQLMLEFPIMADYMTIFDCGRMFFITHGHTHNTSSLPPLRDGDLLIHGHTHLYTIEPIAEKKGSFYINPGSVSLAKNGNENSYMLYENGIFTIKTLNGDVIKELNINE